MGDMKKVGRIGGKALLYFEIVTTIALAIGLIVVNLVRPGAGIDVSKATGDVSQYAQKAAETSHGVVDFIVGIIPENVVSAMAGGELLPILFFAILFGLSLTAMGGASQTRHCPVRQTVARLLWHRQYGHEIVPNRRIWCHVIHHW